MNTNVGSGDRGMTSLLSGERVPKASPRIEACGEVDELSSVLGAFVAALPAEQADRRREIQAIQGDLLHVGARLATSPGSATEASVRGIGGERTRALEDAVDAMEAALPPLQSFILPGGHPTAAWAHVARTVCRRAERRIVEVAATMPDGSLAGTLSYMNRLSTYLFVLARLCNRQNGIADVAWTG
jgi:cob(I)alamin adenosyltransferase